jgi:hypothetical protein
MAKFTQQTTFINGTTADAGQVNTEIVNLGTSVNNIINEQIPAGAAIDGTKLAGGWTAWTPTITVAGGTSPTYTGKFQSRYTQIGKTVYYQCYWSNAAGGVAGAGGGTIVFNPPVNANFVGTTYVTSGWGYLVEQGGTECSIIVGTTAANEFYFLNPASGVAITGADQSSTVRSVRFSGFYESV